MPNIPILCLSAALALFAGGASAFSPPDSDAAPAEGAPPTLGGGPVGAEDGAETVAPGDFRPGALPTILRTEEAMPPPVREAWRTIVDAARSGEIETLRPLLDGDPPTSVAFSGVDDPVDYLKSLSGDAGGREILAILLEVLETGFVHVDEGTPDEMYVWPYFAHYPLDLLSASQIVELFTLLTAADYREMRSYGAYIFFRVGIRPDGSWAFFLAGD